MDTTLKNQSYHWLTRLSLHLLFWLIIVSYFAWGFGFSINLKKSYLNSLMYLPGHMMIVYSLVYFLIPRFLVNKKYLAFLAGFTGTLLLCALYAKAAQLTIESNDVFKGFNMTTGRNILPFIHVAGIAISINLLKYWYQQERKTAEALQQKAEALQQKTAAELQLLKSQIHPHFLFNTLNNLYSFVLEKSDKAPEIVLKLSNLLRFMIYESDAATIPLTTEINLLKQYIALEQLRYGDRLDLSFSVTGNPQIKEMPPLLLLPLIENAFKHGASKQLDQCWISLNIHISDEGLHCKLLNSCDSTAVPLLTSGRGIGLTNVRKRLQLLFAGKHTFSATRSNDVFIVTLDLQWQQTGAANDNFIDIINNVKSENEIEVSARG